MSVDRKSQSAYLGVCNLKWSVLILACFSFVLGLNAKAATNNYYVATTGTDSNNGLTLNTAWKTISHASSALSLGSSGTIVHVAPGTYSENVVTSRSGTGSARITYISDTKWAAQIVPPSTASFGWTNYGNYTDIENFDMGGSQCIGIGNAGSYQTAIGNNVHNNATGCDSGSNGGAGIDDTNYSGTANQILGNFVHDVGMVNSACIAHTNSSVQGIYHSHSGGLIANNLSVNNCDYGIHLWHAATKVIVVNNTSVYNREGILVGSGQSPGNSGTVVLNNIVAFNADYGVIQEASGGGSVTGAVYSYNLAYGNGSGDFPDAPCTPSCITGENPLFVNNTGTAGGDYHLQTGSPAIGTGTTTEAPSTDYDGNPRSLPITIGACQTAGSSVPPPPPSETAYWKFDDATGAVAVDSSGNNHTMTLLNSPTWQVAQNCVVNGCLSFNGTNQNGSVALDLSSTNVITIAFWMKWNAFNNDDKLAFEFSNNFNKSATGFLIDPDESSSGQFWVSVHGDAGYNNAAFPRPSAGVWHHYAFILNKGTATAGEVTPYIDGKAVSYKKSSYSATNANNFGNNTLFVMSRNGSSLFGAGSLDEVHIYPRALSATEIAALSGQ